MQRPTSQLQSTRSHVRSASPRLTPIVLTLIVAAALLLVGCDAGVAVPGPAAERGSTAMTSARASDCYTPKFTVTLVPINDFTFDGAVSGDLEGEVLVQFDPNSVGFAGKTISNAGIAHWDITGGVVPGLGAFQTTFNNRNILVDRPGSPPTRIENTGGHRALDGVAKANLTYRGAFSAVPTPQAHHDYNGVICL